VPRSKPTRVITHRIELGDFERSRIDTLMASASFSQISTPIVSLLKDVSGLAALYVILNALLPEWAKGLDLKAMRDMDSPGLFDYLEPQNLALGTIGALAGVATGGLGWLPALLGFATGQLAAETGEEAYKLLGGAKKGMGQTLFMFHLYMAAYKMGLVD